jgi:lipopolysaccharide export system protein LptA
MTFNDVRGHLFEPFLAFLFRLRGEEPLRHRDEKKTAPKKPYSHGAYMAVLIALVAATPAAAQNLDLGDAPGSAPTPVQITASQGIEWKQAAQEVIATGNAQAVRGAVTVQADQLIAHYRKKAGSPPAPAAKSSNPMDVLTSGDSELYELDAVGHVHIFTTTDHAYGDKAVYSMDESVLVLTGTGLKLTTPHDVITARDAIEYYATDRKAVARGDALVTADDGRSVKADTLVGYLLPANSTAPGGAGQLRKVDAFGHVVIHTTTDTATGNRGVYLPLTGQARLGGNVHITHGPNEMSGADALVNMKTGVATLLAGPGGQVAGTLLPGTTK